MQPHRPKQQSALDDHKTQRPVPPIVPRKISIGPIRPVKVPWLVREGDHFQRAIPIVPKYPSKPEQTGARHTAKVSSVSEASVKPQSLTNNVLEQIAKSGWSRADRLNAKPVLDAYQDLVKQTETMVCCIHSDHTQSQS